jgi:hypothetical protein
MVAMDANGQATDEFLAALLGGIGFIGEKN